MANAFLQDKDGILTSTLSKVDQSFSIYFDQACIAHTDAGATLFCNATSTMGLLLKVDEKWAEVPKDKFPCKMAVTFPKINKDKEKLIFSEALIKYAIATSEGNDGKISGAIVVDNASPMIQGYAAGNETDLNRLSIKYFDFAPYKGEWTLGEAPKAQAYSGGKGYGSSAQKQSEIISDRVDYCITLEKTENAAKLTQAFIALNSVATELADKMAFPDFLKIILK
jgi:hypothetical protein